MVIFKYSYWIFVVILLVAILIWLGSNPDSSYPEFSNNGAKLFLYVIVLYFVGAGMFYGILVRIIGTVYSNESVERELKNIENKDGVMKLNLSQPNSSNRKTEK